MTCDFLLQPGQRAVCPRCYRPLPPDDPASAAARECTGTPPPPVAASQPEDAPATRHAHVALAPTPEPEWQAWLTAGGRLDLTNSQQPTAISHEPTATSHQPSTNCLLILSPRHIPAAVNSLARLPIDQLWLRAMKEPQLVAPLNRFIRSTAYDNYLLIADDVLVAEHALRLVEQALIDNEAATGYCRMHHGSPWYNVSHSPLTARPGQFHDLEDYHFYRVEEIHRWPQRVFPTFFGGWCLTGWRRDLWLDVPFRVNPTTGDVSDYQTCLALNRLLVCPKAAYVDHLRPNAGPAVSRHWLFDRQSPHLIYRRFDRDTHAHTAPLPEPLDD